MNRVLVVGLTDNLGGIESVIMNYFRNINRRNVQFDFLYSTPTIALKDEIEYLGGKTYKITAKHSNFFRYKKDIKTFFRKHANEYSAIWVNFCNITNLDYFVLAKRYGIKIRIIHAHNSQNMGSKLKLLIHNFNKLLIPLYATDFWSCSEVASKWFYSPKTIKSSKYKLINNAIDYSKFKYNEKVRNRLRKELKLDNKIVFGNVSRFHFQKNHLYALSVFKEFLKLEPDSVFLLIGTGEDENKLREFCKNNDIEDKVVFMGVRHNVNDLLQIIDIFLFPSLFEGLSLSLLEAQASRTLVITSDRVSLETKMSDNIYFLKFDSEYKWAKKIHNLYKKYDRKQSKDYIVKNNFDIKNEAEKIEKFFLEMEH